MNSVHYLETSGLNVLADSLADFDFNTLAQHVMKFDWCISSVVLWEVLLNSSDSRRDFLIYWAQFNCSDYLLKSPAELLVSYLELGMPDSDRKEFWHDRESNLDIARVWKRIHKKLDRTIPINFEELKERSEPLRQLSKLYPATLDLITNQAEDGYDEEYFHKRIMQLNKKLVNSVTASRENEKLVKLSIILGFFVICIGVDLDNSPIREFWRPIGIDDPYERLEYLINCSPKIFVKGPLVEMCLMLESQAQTPSTTNRGSIFDSLHTAYCYYADNVISADGHFHSSPDTRGSKVFASVISASGYLEIMNAGYEKAKELFGTKRS